MSWCNLERGVNTPFFGLKYPGKGGGLLGRDREQGVVAGVEYDGIGAEEWLELCKGGG